MYELDCTARTAHANSTRRYTDTRSATTTADYELLKVELMLSLLLLCDQSGATAVQQGKHGILSLPIIGWEKGWVVCLPCWIFVFPTKQRVNVQTKQIDVVWCITMLQWVKFNDESQLRLHMHCTMRSTRKNTVLVYGFPDPFHESAPLRHRAMELLLKLVPFGNLLARTIDHLLPVLVREITFAET